MYDSVLNREITQADLPDNITLAEMETVLKEHGYLFHALGCPPGQGGTGWDDKTVFRAGDARTFPVRGVTIAFAEIRKAVDATANLPNINDPDVIALVEKAAAAAREVLGEKFSGAVSGDASVEFQEVLVSVVNQLLKGETPTVNRIRFTPLAVHRDYVPESRWTAV